MGLWICSLEVMVTKFLNKEPRIQVGAWYRWHLAQRDVGSSLLLRES